MLQTLLGSLWVQPAPAVPTSDGVAAKGPRPNASVYAANLRHIQSHVLPTGWRLNAVQVRGSDQGASPDPSPASFVAHTPRHVPAARACVISAWDRP